MMCGTRTIMMCTHVLFTIQLLLLKYNNDNRLESGGVRQLSVLYNKLLQRTDQILYYLIRSAVVNNVLR